MQLQILSAVAGFSCEAGTPAPELMPGVLVELREVPPHEQKANSKTTTLSRTHKTKTLFRITPLG